MEEKFERYHPDMEAMHHGFRTQPCFVCKLVGGDDGLPRYVSYEDERAIAFLDGYPRAYGYTLVAPKEHREQVTGDFTMEEYIAVQRLVYRVSEAVREEVGAERIYIFTYGSNQGNSHVHWHVVPLPPDVPYEDQQGRGPAGVRACSRSRKARWHPWLRASGGGSRKNVTDSHLRHVVAVTAVVVERVLEVILM